MKMNLKDFLIKEGYYEEFYYNLCVLGNMTHSEAKDYIRKNEYSASAIMGAFIFPKNESFWHSVNLRWLDNVSTTYINN